METSVENYSHSSMDREEKIETKYLSIRETQVETILTVNCQSKETLEVFESTIGAITGELGEIVSIEVEQANDACKTSTLADDESIS